MKRSIVAPAIVLLAGVVLVWCGTARADDAAKTKALPNPFFVLDNGVQGPKFPTPEAQAKVLKELGYDGIGPSGTGGVPQRLAALDKYGLKQYALYVGCNLDPDQPKVDPKLPEVIKQLKGRETCIWLYVLSRKHKPSSDTGDERAVEIIRELSDLCKASGIRIALYPHTGFYVQRVEDAVRVAGKVDRKNVGVTFNLCHWLKVDGPKDLETRLKLARPYLFLVTINGADRDGTSWDRLIQTLDRGTLDNGVLLKMLKDLGYTGPIGLQCYGVKGDKRENLTRSIDAWRKLSGRSAAGQE